MTLSRNQLIVSWILQLIAAAILGQTLFFKFTGAPEAKWIFTTLGVEPWGRIALGVFELVTVILLLVPRTVVWGALLGAALMCGAIFSHLTKLGIVVQNDGGTLFTLAIVTLVCCLAVLLIRRRNLPCKRCASDVTMPGN